MCRTIYRPIVSERNEGGGQRGRHPSLERFFFLLLLLFLFSILSRAFVASFLPPSLSSFLFSPPIPGRVDIGEEEEEHLAGSRERDPSGGAAVRYENNEKRRNLWVVPRRDSGVGGARANVNLNRLSRFACN